MKIILETERLYLREFEISDAINLYHLNSDFDVIKYTGNKPFQSVNEAENFIKLYTDYKKNGFGRWAVCLKGTHEFLGWCGLKKDTDSKEVDLGFRFFKKHWGKGYATESGLACINLGFSTLNLTKIIGRAYIENKSSIRVLKKCKFKAVKNFTYDNQPAVLFEINYDRS
ncbi:GNAT family N-acetyltransferase [Lutibacter maritimus]|uniref:Protein N-acetyltransferase, RimJ/RimL family n=1 Tax=Lutibacter maritimus TaxID=593133 RepID=A0A1I6SIM3_9FLAO|nr:GNAT family N-acetyltransferase [Lutibacter maritimus]SFS76754.1 Protein N-acetyltransferase, RimJ/RimL family [Lutibacter maritimus]